MSDEMMALETMGPEKEYPFEFSVIMAAYNVELFLRQAVDSLISQTFGFDKMQLIMVDDGSTDSTPTICDEYAKAYPKNVIVVHKPNGGVASARNEGLKHATGRYLNFMDSDDYFSDNAFEKVYTFFRKNESETDVVTIPLHFFDAQKGEHWQNGKFNKGTRVIDLYWDYQSTLMFVNASFFANHLKEEIVFDGHLVCGEDIKVILTILIHKMKMGVVTGCKYMYRRRSAGEASLIQSSKKKYGWYFDYFTYLVDWAVEFYQDRLGYLPSFLQYELLCDIQWRYREIYDMTGILTEDEILVYKERIAKTLRYFDDKHILEQKMIWNEHKCYMLSQKYGCQPTITTRNSNAIIHFGNTKLCSIADQYSVIEFINLSKNSITIEGYTKLFGPNIDEPIDVFLKVNDKLYSCIYLPREEINEYRFGNLIYRGIQFRGTITLDANCNVYRIYLVIKYKNCYITKREIRYGKFSPISKDYKNAYYCNNGWAVQATREMIFVFRCDNKKHKAMEKKFLAELWNKKQPALRKAVGVRILYQLFDFFKRKEVWLISDRALSAGDNGEAFFKYLANHKSPNLLPVFVIHKDSSDFNRLKQYGKVVPYLSREHKILYLLCSKVISSHADAPILNPFFKHFTAYRDLMQKQQFIFLQHGITMNDLSKWYSRYRINARGFITSAVPEYNSIAQDNYNYSPENVWLSGFPRFDALYHAEKRRIVIMPTWRAYLVSTDQTTGLRSLKSGFEESSYYNIYSQLLTNERLCLAAQKHNYELHYICHPNMRGAADKIPAHPSFVIHKEPDSYTRIFAESDLLITDYSSVAFDFCYLRKPVIYFQIDYDEFFSGSHTLEKGYFDYERDGFGEVEYDIESTVERIIEYMANECRLKDKYRKRIDNFFAYGDQNNCQRVYKKILELNT